MSGIDVIIIGSGPAGLHAAIALRRKFGLSPLVLEREPEPGGVPRWCHHHTFPCRIKKRLFDGPGYVRAWLQEAHDAGVSIRTSTSVLRLDPLRPAVSCTSPQGPEVIEARAVLLATGARESHRHQRLIAGDRPRGVFTTASLFQSIYVNHTLPAKLFVVFGAEDVSYSCVNVILAHGGEVAAIVEPTSATLSWPPVQWYFERLRGVRHYFAVDDFEIHGKRSVTEVEFSKAKIACDAVIFTGGFTPNAELVRGADLRFNFATRGPGVNQMMQTSAPWIFAAGNCLRGVVPCDEAAFEGRMAASTIAGFLSGKAGQGSETEIVVEPPLAYCCPDRILAGATGMEQLSIWPREHLRNVTLRGTQQGNVVFEKRFGSIQPGRRILVPFASMRLRTAAPVQLAVMDR